MGRKHTVCIYMTKQNDDVLRVVTVVVVVFVQVSGSVAAGGDGWICHVTNHGFHC